VTGTETMGATVVDDRAVRDAGGTDDAANRAFSTSVLVSALRCTLTYVVFPWLLPLMGVAGGVGPGIGVVIGAVAIAANVASIRRFRASNHRWRTQVMTLNCVVIVMLTVLVVLDLRSLLA
jgi:hypothetical protein